MLTVFFVLLLKFKNQLITLNMRKIYLALIFSAIATLAAFAQQELASPKANAETEYTGNGFTASWEAVDGAQFYKLNVFSCDKSQTINATQDFKSVIKNGAIDDAAVAALDGWTIVSQTVSSEDGTDRVVLADNGDYIELECKDGWLNDLNLDFDFIDAELLNQDNPGENSSILKIELFDNQGITYMQGSTYAYGFNLIEKPYNFFYQFGSPIGIQKVRIWIEKNDTNSEGSLAVNSVSYTYYKRDYVISDRQVNGTSYKVTGLDPEQIYNYYVTAHSSTATSAQSNIIMVDGFLAPVATEATDISAQSYTANWNYTPKSTGYIVKNYEVEYVTENGPFAKLDDDFTTADEGTFDEPVTVQSLDEYTSKKGWSAYSPIIADGMIGADNGFRVGPRPMGGYLYSPAFDLSSDGGKYKVHVVMYGTPGDYIVAYRQGSIENGRLVSHTLEQFPDDGILEDTWEMTDGVDNAILCFESHGLKKFFIDRIEVSQQMNAGDMVLNFESDVTINGSQNTSCSFSDLKTDGTYGYYVQAVGNDMVGYSRESDTSNFVVVNLSSTGIGSIVDDNNKSDIDVRVDGCTLHISMPSPEDVRLYSIDGRLLNMVSGLCEIEIELQAGKIYVLSVGGTSYKLIAR